MNCAELSRASKKCHTDLRLENERYDCSLTSRHSLIDSLRSDKFPLKSHYLNSTFLSQADWDRWM